MTTTQTSPPTMLGAQPTVESSAGTPTLDTDHPEFDSHANHAGVESSSPATIFEALPIYRPSRGTQDHSGGHTGAEDHTSDAAAVQDSPPAKHISTTKGRSRAGSTTTGDSHPELDTHVSCAVVGVDGHPAPANQVPTPNVRPLGLDDPLLRTAADNLDDIEGAWVATGNRIEQLIRDKPDKDGVMRGFGLPPFAPEVIGLKAIHDGLAKLMNDARLQMERRFRKHPLYPWAKAHKGIGDKQAPRLIAVVRDPYWNTLHNRPRTVSELWSYCGLRQDADGVAVSRSKGQKANWSAAAKMRAYLMAESCMKQLRRPCEKPTEDRPWAVHVDGCDCSPYRVIFDTGREKYADATHVADCRRCGPKGKPAVEGSPISPGHQMARALRLASREILKDLWLAARDIHEDSLDDHGARGAHPNNVVGGQAGSSTDHGLHVTHVHDAGAAPAKATS